MDAFTAILLLAVGFTIGFGVMWAYCRFFRNPDQPVNKAQ